MTYAVIYGDELYHHGVKGMKWGVRRYQNTDGTYTSAGKKRYTDSDGKESLRARAGKFIKRRKENLKNYRNYKRVEYEAHKKYELDDKREQAQRENDVNATIRSMTWGDDERYYRDFNPIGDERVKDYNRAIAQAKKYTEEKFKSEYGDEKLEQAKKTEDFLAGVTAATIIIGGLGAMAYSAATERK